MGLRFLVVSFTGRRDRRWEIKDNEERIGGDNERRRKIYRGKGVPLTEAVVVPLT
jgi:hypothetical protein